MRLRLSSLFEQGVLQKSEFGVAGVVPVVVQTAGLTFEQQKELLAMQFEQEKLVLRLEKLELRLRQQEVEKHLEVEKVLEVEKMKWVTGDVEKMVAIPAVVQSFHQAPPVDLQVRGDPRAPEWANSQGVGSGMVPDKKLVCADLDVGSGFEPFITEAVSRRMSADPPVSECRKSGVEQVVSLPDLPSSVTKEEEDEETLPHSEILDIFEEGLAQLVQDSVICQFR
ncbi:hypothetical protein NQZ68_002864 [Dissostichus eleginoides]|nr:hypothetical protein NQZ68_002864 [Dissostichus eleginoides]